MEKKKLHERTIRIVTTTSKISIFQKKNTKNCYKSVDTDKTHLLKKK